MSTKNSLKSRLIKISGFNYYDTARTVKKALKDIEGVENVFVPRKKNVFVVFQSDAHCAEFAKNLENGQNLKIKSKKSHKSVPVSDEELADIQSFSESRKRKLNGEKSGENGVKKAKEMFPMAEKTVAEVTMPLHRLPYEKQLEIKTKTMKDALKNISKKVSKESENHIYCWKKKVNDLCCEFEEIKGADKLTQYRNKESLSIGFDKNGAATIGYRAGKTVNGVTHLLSVEQSDFIPQEFKRLALKLLDFVKEKGKAEGFEIYNKSDGQETGIWRKATFRSGMRGNDIQIIVQIRDADLAEEKVTQLKGGLLEHFFADCKSEAGLKSVLLQRHNGVSNSCPIDTKCEVIHGGSGIYEQICGLRFRISPNSFFQVFTDMAEKLYSFVVEWSKVTKESVVLDVCCGTGTIGLNFARHCKRVIGFEIVADAIKDARINSEINEIDNATWIVGDVKDTMKPVLKNESAGDIIAVVDPPRSGLPKRVLQCLRANEKIKRIVYVSCNPVSLTNDVAYLVKAENKKRFGTPFLPKKSTCFDLFPQTKHVEMVMLLERANGEEELPREKYF